MPSYLTKNEGKIAFPRPVPILIWDWDYSDIQQRIARDGRLDREDAGNEWDPGIAAFRTREGFHGYVNKWRAEEEREQAEEEARKHPGRITTESEWLIQQRRRWLVIDPEQERDREAATESLLRREAAHRATQIAEARAFWGGKDPGHATRSYHWTHVTKTIWVMAGGQSVPLYAGKAYWLPEPVAKLCGLTQW